MNFPTLKTELKSGILTVTVDRPEKLNALSERVLADLKEILQHFQRRRDRSVAGMILTGAGDKAFIAGADIKAMSRMNPIEGEAFGRLGQEVTELFESLPVPVIACVNGYALGGGCEMALACDYIYATANAVFGQPEVNLGLIPGFGGCVRLIRSIGPGRAKEMIYSGRSLNSQEDLAAGLVNAVFPTKEAMIRAAEESLALIAAKSPVAVGICKKVINASSGLTTQEALMFEKRGFREAFESDDKSAGVAAFLEKRLPTFPGR